MALLAKIALGPLLLWQARDVRRRAVALAEAAGEREGVVGEGAPLRVLIVGDSSGAGVGVDTQDEAFAGYLTRAIARDGRCRVQWQLIARSGVSTPAACDLLSTSTARPADIAVVVLGVNDVVEQLPLRSALNAREQLVQLLREMAGVRHVVFAPLPPMHEFPLLPQPLRTVIGRDARRLDAAQAAWAARQAGVSHVPIDVRLSPEVMARDGFHPGPEVYRTCGEAIAAFIVDLMVTSDLRLVTRQAPTVRIHESLLTSQQRGDEP